MLCQHDESEYRGSVNNIDATVTQATETTYIMVDTPILEREIYNESRYMTPIQTV